MTREVCSIIRKNGTETTLTSKNLCNATKKLAVDKSDTVRRQNRPGYDFISNEPVKSTPVYVNSDANLMIFAAF